MMPMFLVFSNDVGRTAQLLFQSKKMQSGKPDCVCQEST